MKTLILRISALTLACVVLTVVSVLALTGGLDALTDPILSDEQLSVNISAPNPVIILDAGHGGEDGGASGLHDTLEKELNLQLTLRTADLLSACGYTVLLTRENDSMLGGGESGHKKLADLKYRLDFANAHPEALLLSIHMNKFPMEYCCGIQLYFSGNNEQSLPIATALHKLIKSDLQPENNREIKQAASNIYLLDRVQIPAVLVECGFLSNEEESALLKEEDYQKKLSVLFLAAFSDYRSHKET